MAKQAYVYSLRLPDEHMEKLRVISKENGRSVNKEIEMAVKRIIAAYEAEHGSIELPEE